LVDFLKGWSFTDCVSRAMMDRLGIVMTFSDWCLPGRWLKEQVLSKPVFTE